MSIIEVVFRVLQTRGTLMFRSHVLLTEHSINSLKGNVLERCSGIDQRLVFADRWIQEEVVLEVSSYK